MARGNLVKKDEPEKGFAGLSGMVSDVDATVAKAKKARPSVVSKPKQTEEGRTAPEQHFSYEMPSKSSRSSIVQIFMSILLWSAKITFFALLFSALGAWSWYETWNKNQQYEKFSRYIESNLAHVRSSSYIPAVNGKVLPVDLATKKLDDLYFTMKGQYKPANPEEVSMMLGLNCDSNVVGKYSDGAAAYQITCSAYLIEPQTGVWSNLGRFTGTEPPSRKKGGGSRYGSRPTDAILGKIGL